MDIHISDRELTYHVNVKSGQKEKIILGVYKSFMIFTFLKASFTDVFCSRVLYHISHLTDKILCRGLDLFIPWVMIAFNLWKNCFELKLTLKSFVFTYIRDSFFLFQKVSAQRAFAIWVLSVGYHMRAINWLLLSKKEYLIIKAKSFCSLQRASHIKWSSSFLYHIIYQFKVCLSLLIE